MSSSRSRGRELRPHSRHARRAISTRTVPTTVSTAAFPRRDSRVRPPHSGHVPGAVSSLPHAAPRPRRADSNATARSRRSSSAAGAEPGSEHASSSAANFAIVASSPPPPRVPPERNGR